MSPRWSPSQALRIEAPAPQRRRVGSPALVHSQARGLAWVMDVQKWPFFLGERYHQYHDGFAWGKRRRSV